MNYAISTQLFSRGWRGFLNTLVMVSASFDHQQSSTMSYAVVTCEIKLFENCFSFRRRPSEIVLF